MNETMTAKVVVFLYVKIKYHKYCYINVYEYFLHLYLT